jgi:prepilin-type N-terminal cleavage/methylation domain-containing protein
MSKKIKGLQKGFTIIEVLIVLAIAGLIMVIVFLAVPALQRNARNTQRTNDGANIASSISECLGNKNNQSGSCDQINATEVQLDRSKISQLSNAADLNNITICGSVGGTPCTAFPALTGTAAWTNAVAVRYGDKCTTDGADRTAGAARQVAVLYQVENNQGNGVTRCIDI